MTTTPTISIVEIVGYSTHHLTERGGVVVLPNWYIDDFPVDVDPEYFRDEEEDMNEGVIRESEDWSKDYRDNVPF